MHTGSLSFLMHLAVPPCRSFSPLPLATSPMVAAAAASTEQTATAPAAEAVSASFDWRLCLALAGCAFEVGGCAVEAAGSEESAGLLLWVGQGGSAPPVPPPCTG